MKSKVGIRQKILKIRGTIDPLSRTIKSEEISIALESLDIFQNAKNILFYYSNESEVETIRMIKKWINKKNIYLPKIINDNTFKAIPLKRMSDLKEGKYKISEPVYTGDITFESKLDLIIVPGVAFDKSGNRLGMGKGFYDRYLSKLGNITKIALAYSNQMLDKVPKDSYDESVNIIVTDSAIYYCK